MPRYEVRNIGGDRWEDISEKNFMETLVEFFDKVSPVMAEILHGKEIITPHAIYRLKI